MSDELTMRISYARLDDLRPLVVSLACPKCKGADITGSLNQGEMVATGRLQPIAPPNVHHVCTDCGHEEWIPGGISYPHIEVETRAGAKLRISRR